VEIYIENPFNIIAKYGTPDFNTNVTHKFINTFIKDNTIIIPKKYDFNKLFGDTCPKKNKNILLKVNDKNYVINEINNFDVEISI
jgi:hypothetical protein